MINIEVLIHETFLKAAMSFAVRWSEMQKERLEIEAQNQDWLEIKERMDRLLTSSPRASGEFD